VKKATHRHRLGDYCRLQYLVTDKGVFMLIDGEWKKSTVELSDLKPLHQQAAPQQEVTESSRLIGEHSKTNELIAFRSVADAVEGGFARHSINQCLSKTQHTHRGYSWRWVA